MLQTACSWKSRVSHLRISRVPRDRTSLAIPRSFASRFLSGFLFAFVIVIPFYSTAYVCFLQPH